MNRVVGCVCMKKCPENKKNKKKNKFEEFKKYSYANK